MPTECRTISNPPGARHAPIVKSSRIAGKKETYQRPVLAAKPCPPAPDIRTSRNNLGPPVDTLIRSSGSPDFPDAVLVERLAATDQSDVEWRRDAT